MAWTLDKINGEVRLITGVYSDDIPDDRLNAIIQDYWTVTFPHLIKTESLQEKYRFLTRIGESVYPFPNHFSSLNPIATSEGYIINVSFDSSLLDVLNYQWVEESISVGTGTQRVYNFQLQHYAEPSSLCVFSRGETFFWGDPNFLYFSETKTVSVTLKEPLGSTDRLKVKYRTTSVGRPNWIVVKDQTLTLYPFPDDEYLISISGVKKPDLLPYTGEITGVPPEFFDLIVYGAALKVFSLTDRDAYMKLYPIYKRQESLAMAKTHQQLMYTDVRGL